MAKAKGSAKAKGRRREYFARDKLLAEGFGVTRAAGSFGAWDLVAIRRNMQPDEYQPFVRLVQVKSNRWPASREMTTLFADIAAYPAAWVSGEVWRIRDGAGGKHPTQPEVDIWRLNGDAETRGDG